jgi:hypothetical protein
VTICCSKRRGTVKTRTRARFKTRQEGEKNLQKAFLTVLHFVSEKEKPWI